MRRWLLGVVGTVLALLSLWASLPAAATPGDEIRPPIWDPRLNELNVTYHPAADCSQGCWRLTRAEYLDKSQSGGLHHIFAKSFDAGGTQVGGVPWVVAWADGQNMDNTKPPPDWEDEPMWSCYFPDQGEAGGYRGWMGATESRSDVVRGMGLPYCHHVVFRLSWQWDSGGPPTPSPTRTRTPVPTATPRPTIPAGIRQTNLPVIYGWGGPVVTPTRTPVLPTATATPRPPTATPTPTGGSYSGSIVQTYSNCGLTQLFGVVHDRFGNPQVGRRVRLTWDGNPTPVYATSGSYVRPETDASGWDFVLANASIGGVWRVTVVDALGAPVAPDVLVHTVGTCAPGDLNVAKLRFRQN